MSAEAPSRAQVARRRNARERRSRVLAEGGRRIEVLLLPDAARALDRLEAAREETATAIISALLLQAAKGRR